MRLPSVLPWRLSGGEATSEVGTVPLEVGRLGLGYQVAAERGAHWLMPGVYYALKSAHKEMVEQGDYWVTAAMMRKAAREYWRLTLEGVWVDDPRLIARVTEACKED